MATVLPASTTNKSCDWTIAWQNAESEWATGKSVADYVTFRTQPDGAIVATVVCSQAFAEPVIVTVTNRETPKAKATVKCDYMKRITGISLDGIGSMSSGESLNTENVSYNKQIVLNYGIGTITENYTYSCSYVLNRYVIYNNDMTDVYLEYANVNSSDFSAYNSASQTLKYDFTYNGIKAVIPKVNYEFVDDNGVFTGYGIVREQMTKGITCTITVSGEYSTFTGTLNIKPASSNYAIPAASVSVDNSAITF